MDELQAVLPELWLRKTQPVYLTCCISYGKTNEVEAYVRLTAQHNTTHIHTHTHMHTYTVTHTH